MITLTQEEVANIIMKSVKLTIYLCHTIISHKGREGRWGGEERGGRGEREGEEKEAWSHGDSYIAPPQVSI